MTIEASTSHITPTATASTSAAAPQAAAAPTQTQTQVETHPPVDPPKKHGVAAIIEKIVHPIHGSNHEHSHTDAVSVPVAVPEKPSDGNAHLAPGGSAVGGMQELDLTCAMDFPPPHPPAEPRLPPDLAREILEICALSRPVIIPRLMLVAWRVKNWVEPLLYRIVCTTNTPPVLDSLPQFSSHVLLRALEDKPADFLATSVRYLYLWPRREHHRANMEVVLPACTGVTSLLISPKETEFCRSLGDMSCLRRLTVNIRSLFKQYPEGFAHPLFRNITHLEVFDTQSAHAWEELALVPNLTHFAFRNDTFLGKAAGTILAACPRLQYLVCASHPMFIRLAAQACARLASSDPRFVVVEVVDFERDWMRGALWGKDAWARAEAFVAAKRAGKVDSSEYRVAHDDPAFTFQ
ncbi:hypothetical protein FB451DRAFT_1568205 [Mycena latifolia]|nr:hypothetical protein FB451DRAFT_1568205 [Mycena latifolia]